MHLKQPTSYLAAIQRSLENLSHFDVSLESTFNQYHAPINCLTRLSSIDMLIKNLVPSQPPLHTSCEMLWLLTALRTLLPRRDGLRDRTRPPPW
jgi:hypothetical protein